MDEAKQRLVDQIVSDPEYGEITGSYPKTLDLTLKHLRNVSGFTTKYGTPEAQTEAAKNWLRSSPDVLKALNIGVVEETPPKWLGPLADYVIPLATALVTKRPGVIAGVQGASELGKRSVEDYYAGRDPLAAAPGNIVQAGENAALGEVAQRIAGAVAGVFRPNVAQTSLGELPPGVQAMVEVAEEGGSMPTLGQVAPGMRWGEQQLRGMPWFKRRLEKRDLQNIRITTEGVQREFGDMIRNRPTKEFTATLKAAIGEDDRALEKIFPLFHQAKRQLYAVGDNIVADQGITFNIGETLDYIRKTGDDPTLARLFKKVMTFDETLAAEKNFVPIRELIEEQQDIGRGLGGITIPPGVNADLPIEQVMRIEKNLNKVIYKSNDPQEVAHAKNMMRQLKKSNDVLPEEAREAYKVADKYYGEFMDVWNNQNVKALRKRLAADSTLTQSLFVDPSSRLDTYRALKKLFEKVDIDYLPEYSKISLSSGTKAAAEAVRGSFENVIRRPVQEAIADKMWDNTTGELNFSLMRSLLGDVASEPNAAVARDFAKELWGEAKRDLLVKYARAGEGFQERGGSGMLGAMMSARGISEATMPPGQGQGPAGPMSRMVGTMVVLPGALVGLFTNEKFVKTLLEDVGKPISQIAPGKLLRLMAVVGSENAKVIDNLKKLESGEFSKYERFKQQMQGFAPPEAQTGPQ